MSAFLNQQLTNVGWDALSTALGGGRLTFFKMQAGDGDIAGDGVIPDMTGLVNPVCDIGLTKYEIDGEGQVTLFGNISSAQLDVGFTFRELGVFATIEQPGPLGGSAPTPGITAVVTAGAASGKANPVIPDPGVGTTLMYSYCNSYAQSDYIPGKGETTDVVNTIQVTVKIDKAATVVINITAGQQMSVTNIGSPSVGAGVWSNTQANVAYLKRLVPGTGTAITEDADTITIGQKALQTDTTLYVANGNPDISPNFSTLQKAWDYLSQYAIPSNISAYILMAAGTYVGATTTWLFHNNGDRIQIKGPASSAINFTGATVSGSQYNWNVTLTGLASMTSIHVGSYVIIYNAGGIASWANMLVTGVYRVNAVSGNTATISVRYRGTQWPSMAGFAGGQLYPINTILTAPQNQYNTYVGPRGVGLISDIMFIPAATPTVSACGLTIVGPGYLTRVGVSGYDTGYNGQLSHGFYISGNGASVVMDTCGATNNQTGVVSTGGAYISTVKIASTHNSRRGFWLEGGSCGGAASLIWAAGNMDVNILVADGSYWVNIADYVKGPSNVYLGFAPYGMYTFNMSKSIIQTDSQMVALAHDYWDVGVHTLATFMAQSRVYGSRIFSNPIGVLTSTGALIQ